MNDEDRRFWDARLPVLTRGLNQCGSVDRSLRSALRLLYAFAAPRQCIRATLEAETLSEQSTQFDRCWNNGRWRLALRIALSRAVLRAAYGPHFIRQVPLDFSRQVTEQIAALLRGKPARDNSYLWQAFLGYYPPASEEALPPYLQKRHWSILQSSLSKATFVAVDVVDHLRSCLPDSYDLFALSNVLDAASDTYATALLQAAAEAAAPSALLCLRSFFPPQATFLRAAAAVGWKQDMALKTLLEAENRSPFCPNVLSFRRVG